MGKFFLGIGITSALVFVYWAFKYGTKDDMITSTITLSCITTLLGMNIGEYCFKNK